MREITLIAILFIGCARTGASAGDFAETFDRVKSVWNNIYSFHDKAWTAINYSLASGSTTELEGFYNNEAPREIVDAGKIAFGQLFPNFASTVDGQLGDAKTVWENTRKLDGRMEQLALRAQKRSESRALAPDLNPSDEIADYFGLSSGHGSEYEACAVFKDHKCPACPSGSVRSGADCVSPKAECPSGSVHVASGPGCVSTGLERDGDDAKLLAKNINGQLSLPSALDPIQLYEEQVVSPLLEADLASLLRDAHDRPTIDENAVTRPSARASAPRPPPVPPHVSKAAARRNEIRPCAKTVCQSCIDDQRSGYPGQSASIYRALCPVCQDSSGSTCHEE